MTLLVCEKLEKWIADNTYHSATSVGNFMGEREPLWTFIAPDELLNAIRKGTFTAQADTKLLDADKLRREMRDILADVMSNDVLEPERALVMHLERAIDSGRLAAQADGGLVANADGLLPCPFPACGSDDLSVIACEFDNQYWAISCNKCACNGPAKPTKDEARQAWNTRPSHSGWQPMLTAPYDGTEIELLVRHRTWYQVKEDERDQWQAAVKAKFIMHNGGGWTWAGMTGNILGWRNIQLSPEVKP